MLSVVVLAGRRIFSQRPLLQYTHPLEAASPSRLVTLTPDDLANFTTLLFDVLMTKLMSQNYKKEGGCEIYHDDLAD